MSRREDCTCMFCGKSMAAEWHLKTGGICLSCKKKGRDRPMKDVAIIKDKRKESKKL